jgi:hypothetical protein
LTAQIGFVGGAIVERFDCYEGTPAKAKLSKDLYVQGVNFFARKPISQGVSDCADGQNSQFNQDIGDR